MTQYALTARELIDIFSSIASLHPEYYDGPSLVGPHGPVDPWGPVIRAALLPEQALDARAYKAAAGVHAAVILARLGRGNAEAGRIAEEIIDDICPVYPPSELIKLLLKHRWPPPPKGFEELLAGVQLHNLAGKVRQGVVREDLTHAANAQINAGFESFALKAR